MVHYRFIPTLAAELHDTVRNAHRLYRCYYQALAQVSTSYHFLMLFQHFLRLE